MAYATVGDLVARWRALDTSESATAEALLDDVAILIRANCPDVDSKIDDGTMDAGVPLIISVRAVKRSMMAASSGFDGMTQLSQTAGPFQQSTSFQNPMGELYLTKADLKLLGCGTMRAFTVDLAPDASWPGMPSEVDSQEWL